MGGRRRLRSGLAPWLLDHRGADGRAYNRGTRAGLELAGLTALNGSELARIEVQRFAVAYVVYERAARAWGDLVDQRDRGKGRRPNAGHVERAARRLGLADQTLAAAAARLREMAVSQ